MSLPSREGTCFTEIKGTFITINVLCSRRGLPNPPFVLYIVLVVFLPLLFPRPVVFPILLPSNHILFPFCTSVAFPFSGLSFISFPYFLPFLLFTLPFNFFSLPFYFIPRFFLFRCILSVSSLLFFVSLRSSLVFPNPSCSPSSPLFFVSLRSSLLFSIRFRSASSTLFSSLCEFFLFIILMFFSCVPCDFLRFPLFSHFPLFICLLVLI
jgi:hypothetical protein